MAVLWTLLLRLLLSLWRGSTPCDCPVCTAPRGGWLLIALGDDRLVLVAAYRGQAMRWTAPLSRRSERWAYVRSAN